MNLLGFLVGGWQRWIIYGALLLAALAVAAGWGYHRGVLKLYDYQVKQAQQAVKIIVKQGEVTERVVTKFIKVKTEAIIVEKIVEKEVTRYAESNPGYCLDPQWRVLHDRSAGAIPKAGPEPDGTSGAPLAAEALQTVTENYARCIRTANRLDALQAWVTEQQAVKP